MPSINAQRLRALGLTPAQQAKLIRIGQQAEQGDERARRFFADRPQLGEAVTPREIAPLQPEGQIGLGGRFLRGLTGSEQPLTDIISGVSTAVQSPGLAADVLGIKGPTALSQGLATTILGGEPQDLPSAIVSAQIRQGERATNARRALSDAIRSGDRTFTETMIENLRVMGHEAGAGVPLIGPAAAEIGEGFEEDPLGVTVEAGGLIGGIIAAGSRTPIRTQIRRVLGKPITAKQTTGFGATVGAKKGVSDVIERVVKPTQEPIRQAATELGLKPSDFRGIRGLDNYVASVSKAKQTVQTQFQEALRPVANDVIPGQLIRERIFDFLISDEGEALGHTRPTAVKAYIRQARQFGDKSFTAAEWDAIRRQLTQEVTSLKRAGGEGTKILKTNAEVAAKNIAAESIKDFLYDYINQKTGSNVRSLKLTESALIDMEDFAHKFADRTKRNQAKFDATGLLGGAEQSLGAGIAFQSGRVPILRALTRFLISPEAGASRSLKLAFSKSVPKASITARRAILLRLINQVEQEEKDFGATIGERISAQGTELEEQR